MNYIKNRPKDPFKPATNFLVAQIRGTDMDKVLRIISCTLGFFLCMLVMQAVVDYKFSELRQQTFLDNADIVSVADRERQLECLARNIYHEAANQSFEGKVAVAQVTINRSEHSNWPGDICAVVYQKNIFMQKVVCQFSWYCEGHGKHKPIRSQPHYEESYNVAKKVLLEGFRLEMLNDAYFYHADYVNPKWNRERIGKVGTHIFYRNEKRS
jgi:N-acetylmuramoyl-L-alanine amidase